MSSSVLAAEERQVRGARSAPMTMTELLTLPPAVSVSTAARALGIGKDKAYELIKAGCFPARVIPLGATCRVATASLWEALGVPSSDSR